MAGEDRIVIEFGFPEGEGPGKPIVLSISGMNVLLQSGLKSYSQRDGSVFLVGNDSEEIEVKPKRFIFADEEEGGYQVTVKTTRKIDIEALLNKVQAIQAPPAPVPVPAEGEPDPEHLGPPIVAPPPVAPPAGPVDEDGFPIIPPEPGQLQDPVAQQATGDPQGGRRTRVRKTKRRRTLRKHK